MVSNFNPARFDQLGIGYPVLADLNAHIVVGESAHTVPPGRGRTGWDSVRWCAPLWGSLTFGATRTTEGFGDDVTVFPDHANTQVMASAVLAAINRARRTGRGAHVRSAQAETVLNVLAATYFQESLQPGSAVPVETRERSEISCAIPLPGRG